MRISSPSKIIQANSPSWMLEIVLTSTFNSGWLTYSWIYERWKLFFLAALYINASKTVFKPAPFTRENQNYISQTFVQKFQQIMISPTIPLPLQLHCKIIRLHFGKDCSFPLHSTLGLFPFWLLKCSHRLQEDKCVRS